MDLGSFDGVKFAAELHHGHGAPNGPSLPSQPRTKSKIAFLVGGTCLPACMLLRCFVAGH